MSRVYSENGMCFNTAAFKTAFKKYRSKHDDYTVEANIKRIADKLQMGYETVRKWYKGQSTPIDLNAVKNLASELGIRDYGILLKLPEGEEMTKLNDRQMTAAKRIYDKCIWFLNEFEQTDGFNDYLLEFMNEGSAKPEADAYEKVRKMLHEVFLVCDQEYFDLHSHPIYDELCEFSSDGLFATYNGKFSYAYRFEAPVNGEPSVDEDYDRAMIALNSIVDKYC